MTITDGKRGDLDSVETVAYGDFTFPETIECSMKGTPVYNAADNAVLYTKYTLIVNALIEKDDITPSSITADKTLNLLRQKLTEPGKELFINNLGFGDFRVDSANSVDGVGPKPRLINLDNLGAGYTIQVTWEVEFSMPDCAISSEGNYGLSAQTIVEWTYSKQWQYNARGRFNWTYDFTLQTLAPINPKSRRHEKTSAYNIYIGRYPIFSFPSPDNAKGELDYTLSEDKKTLTGTYSLEEIDTDDIYPPGVEEISIEHDVSGSLNDGGFNRWNNVISGNIRMYPGYNKLIAWQVFQAIFRDRYLRGVRQVVTKESYGKKFTRIEVPRIEAIRLHDRLMTDGELTFSVTYKLNTTSINNLLIRTGLFQPYRKNTWRQWATDPSRLLAQNPTGTSRYQDGFHSVEKVIDICNQPQTLNNYYGQANQPPFYFLPINQTTCPPANDSWLDYKVSIRVISDNNTKVDQRYESVNPPTYQDQEGGEQNQTTLPAPVIPASSTAYTVSNPSGSTQHVEMRGYALRYGGTTNPPRLATVGGQKVVPVGPSEVLDTQVSSNSCPLYLTKWVQMYRVVEGSISDTTNIPYTLEKAITPNKYQPK